MVWGFSVSLVLLLNCWRGFGEEEEKEKEEDNL